MISNIRTVTTENYVIPRDVKRLQFQSRTMSYSPGSGYSKYAMIREKYQNTAKSRATASSLSTSSSSSSVSSSSSPQSVSQNEAAETETFWNRYKREDTKKQSIGKFIKRALSINIKNRPVRPSKSKSSVEILDRNNENQAPAEELYEDVYGGTYQEVYYHHNQGEGGNQNKSKLRNRSMSEIVL